MYEDKLKDLKDKMDLRKLVERNNQTKIDTYLSIVKSFPVFLVSLVTITVTLVSYVLANGMDSKTLIIPFVALVVVGWALLISTWKIQKYNEKINSDEIAVTGLEAEYGRRVEMAINQFIALYGPQFVPEKTYGNVRFADRPTNKRLIRDMSFVNGGDHMKADMEFVDKNMVDRIQENSKMYRDFEKLCCAFYIHGKQVLDAAAATSIYEATIIKKHNPLLTMEERLRILMMTIIFPRNPAYYPDFEFAEKWLDFHEGLCSTDPMESYSKVLTNQSLIDEANAIESIRKELASKIDEVNDDIYYRFITNK